VPPQKLSRVAREASGRNLITGLTVAVTNIPDAMANAVLAGVNPIHGLYALMVGTPVAALTTGSQVMTVAVTGAMALTVADALGPYPAVDKVASLVVLALLVGAVQIVAALLRLGKYMRFVSNAVLSGFLTGVAVNIVLSQVADVTGHHSEAANRVVRAFDTLSHPFQMNLRVLAVTALTIAVVLLVERTRARNLSFLVALIAATAAVGFLGWDIPIVRSLSEIPGSLPRLHWPALSRAFDLLVPAVAIAAVGLIQAAGVSKTTPNPDGRHPDINQDFLGQGLGNAASGLLSGMPVGGSVGTTSLVVQLGGRSRVVNFVVGPLIALVVLLLSTAVEMIPLATLGTLLAIVGVRAISPDRIRTVWQTSLPARVIMAITFGAMMIMPVHYAVLLGVALALVQHVYSASVDVRVVALRPQPSGGLIEEPVPQTLPDASITVLDIYGSVFYAGADAIASMLPDPAGARRPVLILRLRGRTDVGSTFLALLERYRTRMAAAEGRLMLAGVGPDLLSQLERTGTLAALGAENVFAARPELAASINTAIRAAEDWIAESERAGR